MNRRKPLGILTLLAVMLLSMAVFLSTARADGKTSDDDPTPLPFTTPTVAPVITTKTLTPEGNLTLVDDIASASSNDKQFITVVTKSGNYFFIIIDHADEIARAVSEEFGTGLTIIDAHGFYSDTPKTVLYVVVNRFQTVKLKTLVKGVDANAYMAISPVADLLHGSKEEETA